MNAMVKGFKVNQFEDCHFYITNYNNGNTKLDLLSADDKLLAVVSQEVNQVLPTGMIIFNDASYTQGLLTHLISTEILKGYMPREINGKKVYFGVLNTPASHKVVAYGVN